MFYPAYRIEWKIISLYPIKENMYAISNNGWVKNIKTGLILSTSEINSGYYIVRLSCVNTKKVKAFLLHRLVAIHFVENNNPERNTVNHMDGNKHLCEFYNLEWNTQAENNEHAKQTGLNKGYCEDHYAATLTNDQVIQICEMLQDGSFSYKDILDSICLDSSNPKYNNNYDLIGNIRRGIAWNRISKDYSFPKYRHNAIYSDTQIHEMCNYLKDSISIDIIYNKITGLSYINSTINKPFYEFIRKLKNRQHFTEISSSYWS